MKIVVFIKQVPDTDDVKWTENNNIDRTRMESIMNPEDKSAIEAALTIKEKYTGKITAVSMGPKKAVEILQEAIAMGVDEAKLLCDAKFAGSDTCATSRVLASVIKKIYPDTDIILFGQTAIDGETGQTGISTAARLDYPCFSRVKEILDVKDGDITVLSDDTDAVIKYQAKLPVALCIHNSVYKPRLPLIEGYIKAQKYNYECLTIQDIGLDDTLSGIKGSPTYVSSVYKNTNKRDCKFVDNVEALKNEIDGVLK
ncbi:electron transfer flavoprotein subunit beta/FixA family protein [bacterium]|nr:electron transfer flavoprotein subunit beta/FixA family protein [bacterium]